MPPALTRRGGLLRLGGREPWRPRRLRRRWRGGIRDGWDSGWSWSSLLGVPVASGIRCRYRGRSVPRGPDGPPGEHPRDITSRRWYAGGMGPSSGRSPGLTCIPCARPVPHVRDQRPGVIRTMKTMKVTLDYGRTGLTVELPAERVVGPARHPRRARARRSGSRRRGGPRAADRHARLARDRAGAEGCLHPHLRHHPAGPEPDDPGPDAPGPARGGDPPGSHPDPGRHRPAPSQHARREGGDARLP